MEKIWRAEDAAMPPPPRSVGNGKTKTVAYEDVYHAGCQAMLEHLGKNTALMDALRDGKTLEWSVHGSAPNLTITMEALGKGRAVDAIEAERLKLAERINQGNRDSEKRNEQYDKQLAEKDEEIKRLKKALDAKSDENALLARAKAGEVHYTVADMRR